MGQRFGVLCYCIDHYRQEAKACCPETFGECWSSKGLWNSHWHWRGLWCSIGQTKWVFCAKEECSFWVTCISTGSKRANQRHWCACYLFTGPCDNLRVQQGWGHDAGSGHRQMCFEQSLQLTLTRNRPPTGQTSWLLEPSNLHATTIEANSEQPLQHITKLLMTRTAKKLEGKRNVLRSRRIQAARTKAQNCCGHKGHRAKDPSCPAVRKWCENCGKRGHLAGVCKNARKGLKKEQARAMFPHKRMDFGMWLPNMSSRMTNICSRLAAE